VIKYKQITNFKNKNKWNKNMSTKLKLINEFPFSDRPLLLVIMDGVGIGRQDKGDCFFHANTPNIDKLTNWAKKNNLYLELKAHGKYVGLPSNKDIGNSEVGHNAMGAGRKFFQGAELVNQSINNGSIFETTTWNDLTQISENNSLHLIGLLSDGNVHSHIDHVFKILEHLASKKFPKIRIHPLLDGRDVPERSALDYIRPLEEKLNQLNKKYKIDYKIASGGGRMRVSMDRYESDWGVVKKGWDAHVRGIPETFGDYPGFFETAENAISLARELDSNLNDQYLPSFVVIDDASDPVGKIYDGDSVLFFNFRGDRAIQISKAFEEKEFTKFDRIDYPSVKYAGMLEYDHEERIPKQFLVNPPEIANTVSEFIAEMNFKQYACAETHKFGHTTYFWNGNRTGYINRKLEQYEEIQSEQTEMIVKNPGMKAIEVGKAVEQALISKKFDFLRVNFANGDMAGHTGNYDVTIKSIEIMDEAINGIKKRIDEINGILVITADHGNAEEMFDKKGNPKTAHTTNLVPLIVYDPLYKNQYGLNRGVDPQLGNVASSILFFLGLHPPDFYMPSLFKKL
jgi:2,3-bisphosphoglycerate-independent phosphoglycerate mutase